MSMSHLGPITATTKPMTTKGAVKFNSDISQWDTSSLEDMQWMFYETESFTGDLSKWNVSKVMPKPYKNVRKAMVAAITAKLIQP